ncbi:MAG: hypothetical protein IJD26_05620 [Lachnospiraceae bacterium]|nr:hypothetical protein [Lachnospiraceae bacterium]
MRNLEDCRAEVFRRSEERIKERKRNRNRALACCIPLCLLFVAGGLYLRPFLLPVDDFLKYEKVGEVSDFGLGGLASGTAVTVVSAEVTDETGAEGVSRKITDGAAVRELYDFVSCYFELPVAKDTGLQDGADGASAGDTVKYTVSMGQDGDTVYDEIELKSKYGSAEFPLEYKLVFRGSGGEKFVFCLFGNELYYEKNGAAVKLSEEKSEALKRLLE